MVALDHDAPFVEGAPPKPEGAGFYPPNATKAELEAWIKSLPAEEQKSAKGFFTVVHRTADGKFTIVPYNIEYEGELTRAAALLREAAEAATEPTLKKFLTTRADAFLSNDYYPSDVAWMELTGAIEPTIGPYEVYEDAFFNYKAGYEAFITVQDEAESAKLQKFSGELQDIENHLPIDPKYRNPKLGALAPLAVVNEIFASGDANHGVQTAAFNLPNDERVTREKGSKRVMLKNVQDAKFAKTLVPISKVALSPADQKNLSFDAFFTHIVMHEMMHGLGPHTITVNGESHDRPPGNERSGQRAGGSEGGHLRPLRPAISGRQRRDRQSHAAEPLHHLPRLQFPHSALRIERRARPRDGAAIELPARRGRASSRTRTALFRSTPTRSKPVSKA